jgi:PAS domain S-box-containing protein
MHVTTNTIELLYVAAEIGESRPAADEGDGLRSATDESDTTTHEEPPVPFAQELADEGVSISFASVAEGNTLLETHSIDGLLLSDSLGKERLLAFVESIRTEQPSLPVIAFVARRGENAVTELLDAGVTEIIRASAAEAPPSLVRRRIETVLDATAADASDLLTQFQELQERGELFRQVSEAISDVVWVNSLDEEGLTFVNAAYEEVWGRPREELYESTDAVVESIHPDDRERVREAMERQRDAPETYDETYRVVQPDGEIRWVRDRAFGVREDGNLERIVGVAQDITERKNREQELAAERDLIERIFETSPVGIVVHDVEADGKIVRANDQAASLLGVSDADLEGEGFEPSNIAVRTLDAEPLSPSEYPFKRIETTGEPLWDEQLRIDKPSGNEAIISIDGVPIFEDGTLERVVITFDDVTERVRRERQVTEQRDELAQLDHINRIIRGVDKALLSATSRAEIRQAVCERLSESSRYRFAMALELDGENRMDPTAWTDVAADVVETAFPVNASTVETSPGLRAIETGQTQVVQQVDAHPTMQRWADLWDRMDVESMAAIPLSYEGQTYGVVSVFGTEGDAFSDRERDVLDELGGTVGHAIAALESRERERTLTSLYEATEDLLAAETQTEVSEVVVDTATKVLELSGIGIFLFDNDQNVLHPVAGTDTLMESYTDSAVFGPGKDDSITWHTYVMGQEQFYEDVRESERLANPDTLARSALLIPLGDHGVFVSLSPEINAFDDQKRRLVRLLAATTEAALDRVAGEAGIRERDQELQRRTERLERFERLFGFVRDTNRLLRTAGTREEIETGICEQLAALDCIHLAWLGRVPPDGTSIEPRAWAGDEEGYLDAVSLDLDGTEPATRTARTGDLTVVSNVTDHLRDAGWAREAVDRDYQSAIAVPVVNGETIYGILTVYADAPDAFTDVVRESAGDLGEMLGYGIKRIETKRGILAEQVTELELQLDSPGTFLNAVASVTGGRVSFREITPVGEDSTRVLFELSDPPVPDVLALESEFVTVESLTHVQRGTEHLFRATLSGQTVPATLFECGSIPREVTATGDETRATVRIPHELDVRVFLDRVQESYPETQLRTRRDVERTAQARDSVRAALEENLTDRQREVLVTAYESGFFQSPRDTTGEELAALLDLAQPTVTHHLREAQRRLFAALFDDDS